MVWGVRCPAALAAAWHGVWPRAPGHPGSQRGTRSLRTDVRTSLAPPACSHWESGLSSSWSASITEPCSRQAGASCVQTTAVVVEGAIDMVFPPLVNPPDGCSCSGVWGCGQLCVAVPHGCGQLCVAVPMAVNSHASGWGGGSFARCLGPDGLAVGGLCLRGFLPHSCFAPPLTTLTREFSSVCRENLAGQLELVFRAAQGRVAWRLRL